MMKLTLLIIPFLTFTFIQQIIAQERTITGRVISDNNYGLHNVRISIKGKTNIAFTNIDGKYTIKVVEGNILVFETDGFETKEVTIKNQKVLNLTLEREAAMLEEVIVEIEYKRPKSAKIPESIKVDSNIIPSPTEKFKPEKGMFEINLLETKKVVLEVGQKAYYQTIEHGSAGIGVGVTSKDSEVLEKINTHFAYHRVQVRGMTGGDKATRTHIFEAKKVGKTKMIIKEVFRGKVTNEYTIKIIIK